MIEALIIHSSSYLPCVYLHFFFLFTLGCPGIAQKLERQAIAGGGKDLQTPQCRIIFTIGEVSITTLKNNVVLTQGFQQPVIMPEAVVLPLHLIYFTGQLKQGRTHLEWKTAQETGTHYFEVQRSEDGKNFIFLAKVMAKGTPATEQVYHAIDSLPYSPITYYRLKMIDTDQQFTYSPNVLIKKGSVKGFSLFPNPAVAQVWLSVQSDKAINDRWHITNTSGQAIWLKMVTLKEGVNTVNIMLDKLTPGIYLIRSEANLFPSLQFIKQ